MSARALLHLSVLGGFLAVAGCDSSSRKATPIGEAFAGPVTLELRSELSPSAKVVGKANHGDRLEILQTRRRFVRVRTASGAEGWTDTRKLLTTRQMGALKELAARAAKIRSMGKATVYDVLNMHSEPNRYSASFQQVIPGAPLDVLGRRVTERTAAPPPTEPIVKRSPTPPRPVRKKKEPPFPPPPMPAPPPLPGNWMELSRTDLPREPEPSDKEEKPLPPKPVILEDWTLVRAADGRAGWVLSRMLQMSIPDEVAQYSEGARITFYAPLGEVNDEGQKKHHWLWTTSVKGGLPQDFDSFRVFIWNVRRHRYETSYIERGLEGFYPIQVEGPKFTVLLRNSDGKYYTKTFQLEGYLTRWLGNADASAPPDPLAGLFVKTPSTPVAAPTVPERSWTDRLKDWLHRFGRHS